MAHPDDRRERFEAIFRAHVRAVRGYVLRRAPAAIADDVIAETFAVAWRRLEAIGDDPLPWLLGVARRMLANELRSDRRRSALVARLTRERTEGAGAWTPAPSIDPALGAAVAALPPREREALLLVAWEGLEPARAARAAGCSPATFRVRLHRARRRVAGRLGRVSGSESVSVASLEESR